MQEVLNNKSKTSIILKRLKEALISVVNLFNGMFQIEILTPVQ